MLKFYAQLLLCALFLFTSLAVSAQTTPTNHKTPAEELLQNYLQNESPLKVSAASIDLEVSEDNFNEKAKTRTVRAWQKYNGIYIREGLLSLHYNRKGEVYVMDELVDAPLSASTALFDATQAMRRTMNYYGLPAALNLQIKEEKFTDDGHIIFDRSMISASDMEARLMYIVNPHSGELVLVWETQMHTPDRQHYYITYIDASNGKVLDREDKVLHCDFGGGLEYDASPEEQAVLDAQHHAMHMKAAQKWDISMEAKEQATLTSTNTSMMADHTYLVLKEPAEAPNDLQAYGNSGVLGDPLVKFNDISEVYELVQQEVSSVDAVDLMASPFGWHNDAIGGIGTDYGYTQGNNVWAFHDPSVAPLGGVPNPSPGYSAQEQASGNYIYPWDLTKEPEYQDPTDPLNLTPNRNAATTNLFYWNNLIHDVFYHYGLTQNNRAFQEVNYDGSTGGGDDVLAQSQDGGGTNNANFLTLADGVNGQMQMYLWTASILDELVKIDNVNPDNADLPDMSGFGAIEGALYNGVSPGTARVTTAGTAEVDFVIVNAGCGSSEGCGTGGGVGSIPCNNTDTQGKIVLIDRGSCSFAEKVDGAQQGNAIGVIVMNNDQSNPDAVIAMGGTDPTVNTITIPSVMISYNNGLKLKNALASGTVRGRLKRDTTAQPKKDGDFDNGIIAHEYGHGITTRLSPPTATGGSLSGSEQGGEGWADYIALYMTMTDTELLPATANHANGVLPNRGIGSYIRYTDYNGAGIRPRPYSIDEDINEYTMAGDANGGFGINNTAEITVPHGVGFVWCTFLYEVSQTLVDRYGISSFDELPKRLYNAPNSLADMIQRDGDGNIVSGTADGMNLAMRLILRGIELQPQSPTFIEMRDGIIAADAELFGGEHTCDLWKAFAKRGLGINAINPDNNLGNEVDGFGIPQTVMVNSQNVMCGDPQIFYSITKSALTVADNQTELTYSITVKNTSPTNSTATNVTFTDDLPPFTTVASATGPVTSQTATSVTWTIPTLAPDAEETVTVNALLSSPQTTTIETSDDFEGGTGGWTASGGGVFNSFGRETDATHAHSGTAYFFCENTNNNEPNAYLTSPTLPTVNGRQLRFWHKYVLDAGYDGVFIEGTNDGGITWTKINMQENPYTGSLNGTFNPVDAGTAYTGGSGYIESAGSIPDDVSQIRFVLSEDVGGGSGEGWWVDDIKIVTNPIKITNTVSITDPIGSGGRIKTSSVSTLILGDAVPLAVNLVNLKATPLKKTIQLDWLTTSEINNKGFSVERKAPSETTFTKIGFVDGQGTSNGKTTYVFEDKNVIINQTYSYRLLQEDLNGKETPSNIVVAKIVGQDINMNIVPNPAQDVAQVNITNATQNSQVRILSVDGKVLHAYPIDAAEQQTLRLNLQDLPAGMYMVQLQTAEGLLVQKLVIE